MPTLKSISANLSYLWIAHLWITHFLITQCFNPDY